jgi:hypothetical protein
MFGWVNLFGSECCPSLPVLLLRIIYCEYEMNNPFCGWRPDMTVFKALGLAALLAMISMMATYGNGALGVM